MNKIRRYSANANFKFVGSADGTESERTFSGYASVFNGLDSYNDTILPGAFSDFVEKANTGKGYPRMFFEHRNSWLYESEFPSRIGKWSSMEEDDVGLLVKGSLTPGHPVADAVWASMKAGVMDGMSIAFYLDESDYEYSNGTRVIKRINELFEISLVEEPADRSAKVDLQSLKSAVDSCGSIRDFEKVLRDAGHLSRESAKVFVSKFKEVVLRDAEQLTESENKTHESELSEVLDVFSKIKLPVKIIGVK